MNLFRYRPLFFLCTVFMCAALGGLCLFGLGLPLDTAATRLLIALAVLSVLGAAIGAVLWIRRRRAGVSPLIITGVAVLLATAALFQSYTTFAGDQATRLDQQVGETVTVTATLLERRGAGGFLSSFSLRLHTVDGITVNGNALLTCHYPAELSPGQVLELQGTLVTLTEAAGDGYDATALRGDGYVIGLLSEDESLVEVIGDARDTLRVRAGNLRRTWAARLNLLTGRSAEGLPSALLLGDKSALSDAVRRDFSRAGVSHLLAISGLHMTLLFGLLEMMLRVCRVPRRARALLLSVAALGYLILLGFPPSATRAVIMLGAVYLSTLLSTTADPLTSLGLAGALILATTPSAVADAGFWMSYLATLGLVALTPPLQQWFAHREAEYAHTPLIKRLRAWLWKVLCGLLVGVIALSFTLFVVAAVIGKMGILSPVSTLILTPLCGVILVASLIALPLFGTATGEAVGTLISMVSEWMIDLSSAMADPSWTVVSLVHPAVLPLAGLMLVALLVLLAVRLPKGKRWTVVLPMLVGWLLIGCLLTVEGRLEADKIKGSYLQPSTQSDMLVLVEGREAVIIDMSNGSLSSLSAASMEASRRGATEISVIMLTHYHTRTAGALSDLFGRETVRTLWVPMPTDEQDYYCLLACMEKAAIAGVPISLYQLGEPTTVFSDFSLTLYSDSVERSVQPVLLLSLTSSSSENEASELVVCGSSVFESAMAGRATRLIECADTVIFGNHGPLPKKPFGASLNYRENVTVILSEKGNGAGYFQPQALPDSATLWRGQMRFSFP